MKILRISTFILSAFILASNAMTQGVENPCAPLNDSLKDFTYFAGEREKYRKLIDYARSSSFHSGSQARSLGLSIVAGDYGLGLDWGSKSSDEFKSDLISYLETEERNTASVTRITERVNPIALDYFLQCIRATAGNGGAEVSVWFEPVFGRYDEFYVNLLYQGNVEVTAPEHEFLFHVNASNGQLTAINDEIAESVLAGQPIMLQRGRKQSLKFARDPQADISIQSQSGIIGFPGRRILPRKPDDKVECFAEIEDVRVFYNETDTAPVQHPSDFVSLPEGYKLIGGGVRTHASECSYDNGQLVVSSHPKYTDGEYGWFAGSKDHGGQVCRGRVQAFAVGLYDPSDQWEVVVDSQASSDSASPSMQVQVRTGYIMTGGGIEASSSGHSQLAVSSFPSSNRSWTVKSKDHVYPASAKVRAYVIGIRPRDGLLNPFSTRIDSNHSGTVEFSPTHEISSRFRRDAIGTVPVGGGSEVDYYSGHGALLTGSFPLLEDQSDGLSGWTTRGSEHSYHERGALTNYLLYMVKSDDVRSSDGCES